MSCPNEMVATWTCDDADLSWPAVPISAPSAQDRRPWAKMPHELRYRRQHEVLLRLAEEAISDRSYEKISLGGLVAAAGVSKRSFYEHFASKEHCFAEIYRRVGAAFLQRKVAAAQRLAGLPPAELIFGLVANDVAYLRRAPDLCAGLERLARSGDGVIAGELAAIIEYNERFVVVLARRLGSPLSPNLLRMAASVLIRAEVTLMPALASGADPGEVADFAAVFCRSIGLPTEVSESRITPSSRMEPTWTSKN